jgi:peroxiredoxin
MLEHPLVRSAIALVLLAVLGGGAFLLQSARSDGSAGPRQDETAAALASRPAGTPAGSPEPGLGALDGRAPVVGQPAPDFALRTVDGKVVKLSNLRGKVVWINFWATWCAPCTHELPEIEQIYNDKRDQGLEVLEVNWQETAATARSYFDERKLPMPVLLDTSSSVFNQYRLQGLPDHFFIDRDGKVAALYFGQLTADKMKQKLAAAGIG